MQPAVPTTSDETLFQIGFVTRDIRASMREFTQRLGVGPWHLRERGVFPVQFYRGKPTGLALAVAMGYAPSSAIQYELIQQLDDLPSIYTDVLRRQGQGFHHYGVLTRNYEVSAARYKDEGFEAVYEAEVPGGRVAFFDTTKLLAGMVEIVQRTHALVEMFEGYRASSISWDGRDPVRLRAPLPPPSDPRGSLMLDSIFRMENSAVGDIPTEQGRDGQVSPEVLVLIEIRAVRDAAELAAYQAEASKQMTQRGGVVIGRGGASFEGDPVGPIVVQRWPSEADFRAWQRSEEYRPLLERRKRSADLRIAIVPAN